MTTRRDLIRGAGAAAIAVTAGGTVTVAALPETATTVALSAPELYIGDDTAFWQSATAYREARAASEAALDAEHAAYERGDNAECIRLENETLPTHRARWDASRAMCDTPAGSLQALLVKIDLYMDEWDDQEEHHAALVHAVRDDLERLARRAGA